MLLIKTSVRKTNSIPGEDQYGIFTSEYVSKGQIIWDYQNVITVREETFRFLQEHKLVEYTEKYGTVDEFGVWTVDSDNTKYMNHADKPNVLFIDNIGIALKDIDLNQELFCDYRKITSQKHFLKLMGI